MFYIVSFCALSSEIWTWKCIALPFHLALWQAVSNVTLNISWGSLNLCPQAVSLKVGSEQTTLIPLGVRMELCVAGFMWRSIFHPTECLLGSACEMPTLDGHVFHTLSEGQDVVGLFPRETIREYWSQIIYNLTLTVRGVDSHSHVPQIRTALETGPTQILNVTTQGSGPPSPCLEEN